MAQTNKDTTNSAPANNNNITLAQLITSLSALGINVSSPQSDSSSGSGASSSTAPAPSNDGPPSALTVEALITALSTLGLNVSGSTSTGAATTSTNTTGGPILTGGVPRVSPLSGGPAPAPPAPAPAAPAAPAPSAPAAPISAPAAPGGSTEGATMLTGFVCAHCNTHNLLRPAKDTWYVVTVGRQVGVFQGWHQVQPLVSTVPGACYRKYPSREQADAAYQQARAQGNVHIVAPPAPPPS
ncbi:hypothetical protein DFP72DRAFT_1059572 [Ephemerocybe angulata]|uniref:Ribonuclease H1 N-terminal domain-containing protein n=1 Tax=Ephemerocybe angulata TaxID=980116 RepID=A0A8H6IFD8_9AGAR|nr:hypothetical protein DFP72DRAFT_1059572 [Tulosesus angulatus]